MKKSLIVLAILIGAYAMFMFIFSESLNYVELNKEFSLKINQNAFIRSEFIKIKLIDISDSRCPKGVQCVWAGEARAEINILKNNQDVGTFNLTLGSGRNDESTINFDKYSVKLTAVEPYPILNQTIKEKIATLLVQKLNS